MKPESCLRLDADGMMTEGRAPVADDRPSSVDVPAGGPGSSLCAYVVERLGSAEDLAALQDPWEALTAEIREGSFFLTWGWIHTWWRFLHADHDLWLLTARDQEGRLAGIAPWMCRREKIGPLTVRRLSFIGRGLARPTHLDIVARSEEREALAAAFVRYLQERRNEWDLLELEGLRENSPLVSALAAAPGLCLSRDPVPTSFVSLPDSWEIFQKQAMSSKLRKTIRYYERRLEKAFPGRVVFELVTTEADLKPALDFLVRNSCRQFRHKGVDSCFEDQDFRAFFENMVLEALRDGALRFFQLKVEAEIVAVQQCFHCQGILYGYQTAFDPDWGKYSPGQQLLAHLFRRSILEKDREIDMMHGETDYKASWASDRRRDAHILYARDPRGKLGVATVAALDKAIVLGRQCIPGSIRKRLNLWLSGKIR